MQGVREDRCAGVNSFGFGGTNAHVVLAAPPPRREETPAGAAREADPAAGDLGGHRGVAARAGRQLARILGRDPGRTLRRLAARCRARRAIIIASGWSALGRDRAGDCAPARRISRRRGGAGGRQRNGGAEGKLAFVFSGNGAQFPGMGRAAMRANAAFRAAVETVDEALRRALGWSVAELIEGGVDAERAGAHRHRPAAAVRDPGRHRRRVARGRDRGRAAMSATASARSPPPGPPARCRSPMRRASSIARSRSQQRTQGAGRMAALALGGDAAPELSRRDRQRRRDCGAQRRPFGDDLRARARRSSGSAPRRAAAALVSSARSRFRLPFAAMDPIRDELLASLAGSASRPPAARLVSTVTGDRRRRPARSTPSTGGATSATRCASPTATAALIGEGYRIFVEIGPSPILHSYLADGLRAAEAEGRVLATLSRSDGDGDPFPAIAARCYVAGYDLAPAPGFDGPADPRGLPLYPWQRERFWFDKTVEADRSGKPALRSPAARFPPDTVRPPTGSIISTSRCCRGSPITRSKASPVFPAAAILETALAAARWRWPEAAALEAFDVELRRPLPFDRGRMRELRTTLLSDDGDWELASRPRLSSEPMTVHAVGRIAAASDARPVLRWPIAARPIARRSSAQGARASTAKPLPAGGRAGLDYGRRFRTVDHVDDRRRGQRRRRISTRARSASRSTTISCIQHCSTAHCKDCSGSSPGMAARRRAAAFCPGGSAEPGCRRRLAEWRAAPGCG